MKFTHTTFTEFGNSKLPPIPKSQEKQIEQLEYAVYELIDWLMDELGWDNERSIIDRMADEVNKIATRAYDKHSQIDYD